MTTFPERPTCHDLDLYAQRFAPTTWQQRGANKHCSYCGSLHPEELLALLALLPLIPNLSGGLELADMKYGWPHKFYLSTPTGHFKFYNEHLLDLIDITGEEPVVTEAFTLVTDAIAKAIGIHFTYRDKRLHWGPDEPAVKTAQES